MPAAVRLAVISADFRIASTNGPMSDTSNRGSSNSAASSATW